jgi:stage IV sporulation protein FB
MMTDPLIWAPINLGRWFGTQVRLHIFLVVFVVVELLNALIVQEPRFVATAAWISLLLLALAIHELAHAVAASWIGGEPPEEIQLWPLGNMACQPNATRSPDHLLVVLAGPLANAFVAVFSALILAFFNAQFVWNPFGNPRDSGAPLMLATNLPAVPLTPLWWLGWFGYLNYVLMVINLTPALPFDGGRAFRLFLANSSVNHARDGYYGLWTAHTSAAVLVVVGVIRLISNHPDGVLLISLAIPIELIVRSEARMMDDGGYFEDGVFGYDFSEGYTSLEANAAKVRPYRESAIKRWRRRRSDLRRQRMQAREAAEERRMDEILEKLHREGRHALTDEEHRFLIRVSVKYRNRPKAHD